MYFLQSAYETVTVNALAQQYFWGQLVLIAAIAAAAIVNKKAGWVCAYLLAALGAGWSIYHTVNPPAAFDSVISLIALGIYAFLFLALFAIHGFRSSVKRMKNG